MVKSAARTEADPQIEAVFFEKQVDFRNWLEQRHDTAQVLWVGFRKKASGRPSITWPESVDEALCFGWIDGIRKSLDDTSYAIRFTPRKPGSIWSSKNIRRTHELIAAGQMTPAGLAAFEKRSEDKARQYSFEQGRVDLGPEYERKFRENEQAWAYFQAQPPSYRKTATWWVVSAKREDTRLRRLQVLIDDSAAGQRIGPLRRNG